MSHESDPVGVRLENLPDVLRPADVCQLLGLSKNSVYDALRRGDLPSVRLGRRILVPKALLERFLTGAAKEEGAR